MSMLSPERQTKGKTANSYYCALGQACLLCANAAKTIPDNKNGTPGLASRVPLTFERGYAIIGAIFAIAARFAIQTLLMMLSPMA
jgi:hypothetical protein